MKHKNLFKVVLVLVMALIQLPLAHPAQAATYWVTNTSDSGAGSLRQAIIDANTNPPGIDTIQFNIPMSDSGCNAGTGVCTIQPAGPLPDLTGSNTIITGYSQPGAAVPTATTPAVLKIELDGTNAGAGVSGLTIRGNYIVIAGLVINRFASHGVYIRGSAAQHTQHNGVAGNHIGTDVSGTVDLGNGGDGVYIRESDDNIIGGTVAGNRNVIAGNSNDGVFIFTGNGNVVEGNYIGTDATGTAGLGNEWYGVYISGSNASNNTVGGDSVPERNVISGNNRHGVYIGGTGGSATGNTVLGNYIGTNADGTGDLGNGSDGVAINGSAVDNTIGGDAAGERNVISGNSGDGISISGSDATGNTVLGNYIGLGVDGSAALGNDQHGVYLESENNTIGGDTTGERNVISSNGMDGVSISGGSATGNVVSGNYIGTNADGSADRGNGNNGVAIGGGAADNTVGGNTSGERNIISANGDAGIRIQESDGNIISGNTIGLDANGTAKLGNDFGVFIIWAQNNTIGGDMAGEGNVISGNDSNGVTISGSGTMSNTVAANFIGTDVAGGTALGNGEDGVHLRNGAANNTIGGSRPSLGNLISGNAGDGVDIRDSGTMSNTVAANFIGTAADGAHDQGNGQNGVNVNNGASNNTIGGDRTVGPVFKDPRNVISGNNGDGVHIEWADNNTVLGNMIGLTGGGSENDLGNTNSGVALGDGAQNNLIGGDVEGEQNIISGNDQHGVFLIGTNTSNNTVSGNIIGTNSGGTVDRGNTLNGVYLSNGAQNNTVGPNNVIVHNGGDGVEVNGGSTTGNAITQNSIYSNTMGIDLAVGANGGILPPTIITTTVGSVNIVGTACAGCTVEVFANGDTDGEGEAYVGQTIADGSGDFTLTVSSLSQPYLTATATDTGDGTSEFSEVFEATVELSPGSGTVYLPIVVKNN